LLSQKLAGEGMENDTMNVSGPHKARATAVITVRKYGRRRV
jgi:hypothetical protein